MKRIALLMITFTILVSLLTSCGMGTQEDQIAIDTERAAATLNLTEDELKFGTFTANNTPELSDIKMTEYNISKFDAFFNSSSDTSIDDVNERFPLECLRCRKISLDETHSIRRFYTVYKVKEGGYYYVFWEIHSNNINIEARNASYNGYISSLSSDEDFAVAVTITGTDNEIRSQIREIDPAAEFKYRMDVFDQLNVYRILTDGKIQELTYSHTNFESDIRYCTSRYVYSRYDLDCCLGSIFTSDLPTSEEIEVEEQSPEKELLIIKKLSERFKLRAEAAEMDLTESDMRFSQFTANNSIALSEHDLPEYELSDLYTYFGRYDPDLATVLQESGNVWHGDTYPSNVNNWFPLQCIRCVRVESADGTSTLQYYTVYKVKEGGYFYVFWSYRDNNYQIGHYGYMPHLNSTEDFESITVGESTLADVYLIDPALDFRFNVTSSGAYSLSLLDSGEVLRIDYKYQILENIDSLEVTNITILSKDEGACCLTQIFEADLPSD